MKSFFAPIIIFIQFLKWIFIFKNKDGVIIIIIINEHITELYVENKFYGRSWVCGKNTQCLCLNGFLSLVWPKHNHIYYFLILLITKNIIIILRAFNLFYKNNSLHLGLNQALLYLSPCLIPVSYSEIEIPFLLFLGKEKPKKIEKEGRNPAHTTHRIERLQSGSLKPRSIWFICNPIQTYSIWEIKAQFVRPLAQS